MTTFLLINYLYLRKCLIPDEISYIIAIQ